MKKFRKIIIILMFFIIAAIGAYFNEGVENEISNTENNNQISYEISNIPEFNGQAYIEINNNIPKFTEEDMSLEDDYYSDLESGRVRNGNGKDLLG